MNGCPEWFKKLVAERLKLIRNSYDEGHLVLTLDNQPQYVKERVLALDPS